MTFNIKSTIIAAACCIFSFASHALTLPHQIGDNMVLQQDIEAGLWGWAKPGSTVKITPSWANKATIKATADKNGRWKAIVATPKGSYTPQTITFEGDKQRITVSNVLIGEVWIASGQSNMEMPVGGFGGQPIDNNQQTIAYANQYRGKLRMVNIPHVAADTPRDSVDGSWQECTPATVASWSACAYYFAESLNRILDVPVGIIHSSWGGSLLEEWMPDESIKQFNDIKFETIAQLSRKASQDYNGMIYPLLNYTIRGFIWNQGESQVFIGDYSHAKHFASFLQAWRKAFNQGDLPMYCVEIPGYNYGDVNGTMAPIVRESQWQGADMAGNCYVISTSDLIKPGMEHIIHGSIKQPIGERLAFMAAAKTYGLPNMACDYPRFKSMEVHGKQATLTFTGIGAGWAAHHNLQGFEAAGEDKRFYPATAQADMGTSNITVTCEHLDKIAAVRYCFKNWAIGTVHTCQWLPLVPFRTDNW